MGFTDELVTFRIVKGMGHFLVVGSIYSWEDCTMCTTADNFNSV